jgi:phosphosulfolactate phosphohydrolase-like enzyme
LYRACEDHLEGVVRNGNHARSLIEAGFGRDITAALHIDRYGVAPRLESGAIAAAAG